MLPRRLVPSLAREAGDWRLEAGGTTAGDHTFRLTTDNQQPTTLMTLETCPILVLGSINVDLVVQGPRLPAPGETVLGGDFFQAHGGKGANQAVAAARAARGLVRFVAAVGDDAFGQQSLAALAAENLRLEAIHPRTGLATGVALILVDQQGENLISVASGANAALTPADIDCLSPEVFASSRIFLASLEIPLPTVVRALELAKQFGLRTIVNPAPACLELCDPKILRLIDVLTPNEGECRTLAAALGCNAGLLAAAIALRAVSGGAAVVTLGGEGCLVVDQQTEHVPARRVAVVDTTAAGDAFNGALAVALSEGRSLVEAARWANQAAALSVTRRGAQPSLPHRAEIDASAGSVSLESRST